MSNKRKNTSNNAAGKKRKLVFNPTEEVARFIDNPLKSEYWKDDMKLENYFANIDKNNSYMNSVKVREELDKAICEMIGSSDKIVDFFKTELGNEILLFVFRRRILYAVKDFDASNQKLLRACLEEEKNVKEVVTLVRFGDYQIATEIVNLMAPYLKGKGDSIYSIVVRLISCNKKPESVEFCFSTFPQIDALEFLLRNHILLNIFDLAEIFCKSPAFCENFNKDTSSSISWAAFNSLMSHHGNLGMMGGRKAGCFSNTTYNSYPTTNTKPFEIEIMDKLVFKK